MTNAATLVRSIPDIIQPNDSIEVHRRSDGDPGTVTIVTKDFRRDGEAVVSLDRERAGQLVDAVESVVAGLRDDRNRVARAAGFEEGYKAGESQWRQAGAQASRTSLRDSLIEWHRNYAALSASDFNEMLDEVGLDPYSPITTVRVTVTLDLDVEELGLTNVDDLDVDRVSLRACGPAGEASVSDWTLEGVEDVTT